jgi:hypothetical protein
MRLHPMRLAAPSDHANENGRYGLAAPFPAPVPAGRPSSRRDRPSFGRARCSVRPGASETVPSADIDDLASRPLRSGAGEETNRAGNISGSANPAKRTRRDHRCFALVKSRSRSAFISVSTGPRSGLDEHVLSRRHAMWCLTSGDPPWRDGQSATLYESLQTKRPCLPSSA